MSLKEKIIAESQRLGIDKIGFASADPFYELAEPLKIQQEKGYNSGFEHPDLAERIYPEKTFENSRTIIAIALAYPTKIKEEVPRDEKRGMFARASWGQDYHDVLHDRLNKLVTFIRQETQNDTKWRFAPQVDTGELVDVAVAQRAGLGFIGRNGLLITEEFGSFVYLGEIITNIDLEKDSPIAFGCGTCQRCIQACPTQALLGDGSMNAKRCLSYQTQTKDLMPVEYRKKIRNVIYGCDICQLACPYNKGKDFHLHPEMEPELEEAYPRLKPMLELTNREFKTQFGHLAGSWRGKKTLQRNALIALANLGDRSALPEIWHCASEDPRPVIRGTAVWAIGRLGNRAAIEWSEKLNELLTKETDMTVINEINEAIKQLRK